MEWDKNSVSKDEYYNLLAVSQIKNDCETFKSLLPTLNQPIVILAMMPHLSLFCKAIEEYCEERNLFVKVQNNSPFSIENCRAKLKLFNEKYGRSLRYVETVDNIQDTLFKDQLRFSFLKYLNVNYNLGIFFDSKGNVISDTQFLFSMFQGKKPKAQDLIGEELMEFGKTIGSVIASVSQGLSEFLPQYNASVRNISYSFFYKDINTNRNMLFRSGGKLKKSEALILLHTLGGASFAKNIIGEIALRDNPWRLRTQYISMYYAIKEIRLIADRTEDAEIACTLNSVLSKVNSKVLNSNFRSCMMHYGFNNKGKYLIDDQYLDYSIPFFGLVETCFDGISFSELEKEVYENLCIISDQLTSICLIDSSNVKAL